MRVKVVPADTTSEAARVQFEIFRRIPASKRLELACQMSTTLRKVVAAGVRQRHPELRARQVELEVMRLTLGDELFAQVLAGGQYDEMTQEEFLMDVVRCLEAAGIPFMVTGSYGSSYHGQSRATNDVDLVIDPTAAQLEQFLALLGERYYVSPEAAREAFRHRALFNIIDFTHGWKADLILRKNRPYSIEEFQRRQTGTFLGQPVPIATAEDVILTKLEWDKLSPSERQVRDALNVAVVQGTRLDQDYLRKWAPLLGIADQLEEILRQAAGFSQPPHPVDSQRG